MKITEVTSAKWDEIEKLKNSVIASMTTSQTDDEIIAVVREIYKKLDKIPKAVIISDCPITGALFYCALNNNSQFHSQLTSHLHSQLGSQLGSQLTSHLQLNSQFYSQLGSQLNSQLHSQLNSQLHSQLYSQLH